MSFESIVETEHFNGIAIWRIRTPTAQALVSPHGGQLLSWRPGGSDDVFWCSPQTRLPPHAIRGGVPVCWPYFGRQSQTGDVPQHGHARISQWRFIDARREEDDVILDLGLPADARTPLILRQRLRIGATLEQTLITENTGQHDEALTQALHSYFAVSDAMRVRLEGVDGLTFDDKLLGGRHRQRGDWRLDDPHDPGRCDRIYVDAGSRFVLEDSAAGRRIRINTEGSQSLVVWNPGATGAPAIADLPGNGWRGFLCVEVANAGDDVVMLPPGGRHRLSQRLTVSSDATALD